MFLNAKMKSTIGVGPSCLLKISFQDHQDANPSMPYVCQESPKACGDPSLSSKALRVQHMKVGDSFFSFFSPTHCRVYQALNVYSAIWRYGFHGALKRIGDISSIWELTCLFLSAKMKPTIVVGPSCPLKISSKDHQDAILNRPNFLSRVPIGASRSLLILKGPQGSTHEGL